MGNSPGEKQFEDETSKTIFPFVYEFKRVNDKDYFFGKVNKIKIRPIVAVL